MPNTREMMKKDSKKKKGLCDKLCDKLEEVNAMFNPGYILVSKMGDTVEKLEKLANKVKKGEKVSAGEVIDIATDVNPATRMVKDIGKELTEENPIEHRVESVRKIQDRLPWNKANQGR